MSTMLCDTTVRSTDHRAGSIDFLPASQLRTSYACLRPGAPQRFPDLQTAQLPIRVVPTEEGTYEVIDGFKRLAAWREGGHQLIPVVLEAPGSTVEHKCLLLAANSPARTLTALDEARVICSLVNEEGLTAGAVARRLGRKVQWVARRMDIGTRLCAMAEEQLARGLIGPTLAHALCSVTEKDQQALLGVMERHGLHLREMLALLSAYRVADETDRRELLRAPLAVVRAHSSPDPVSSPTAVALEKRLEQIHEALMSLASFVIPDEMAPGEKRRLQARLKSLFAEIETIGGAYHNHLPGDSNEPKEQPTRSVLPTESGPAEDRPYPRDARGDRTAACLLRQQRDLPTDGLLAQDRSSPAARTRVAAPERAFGQSK
jgi:hypothetical protein